jgi:dihydropteroate synthase
MMSQRIHTEWQLRSRILALGARTLVMGVVNITPDSFSDGGLYMEQTQAIEHALRLLDEGADLLDLGAESTRPDSQAGNPQTAAVSAEEEQARLLPVLEGLLRARPDAIVSIDTYKSATARTALASGAEIINDVSGSTWDAEMAKVCAAAGCGVVLMHTRGRPDEWRKQPRLAPEVVLSLVREGLASSLDAALAAQIRPEATVLDAGYGFGKRFEENYALLARQAELLSLGRPLLAGLSRKSFLARTLAKATGSEPGQVGEEARETASIAALTAAILHGASIVRVHRVQQAVEAAAVADALLASC